jgi:preprotein translocase subunit YajC
METKGYLELSELYSSIYNDVSESHYKVGDKVLSKSGGMKGEVVKLDSEEKGKYYTVKHSDGKTAKYSPDELKKGNGGDQKKKKKSFIQS